MKNILPALFLMLAATAAFAGGDNEGTSLCSYAAYTCQSPNIVACPFEDSTLVDVSDGKASNSQTFDTKEVPPAAGMVGAPTVYKGPEMTLWISAGILHPALLTVPGLGIHNAKLHCVRNAQK